MTTDELIDQLDDARGMLQDIVDGHFGHGAGWLLTTAHGKTTIQLVAQLAMRAVPNVVPPATAEQDAAAARGALPTGQVKTRADLDAILDALGDDAREVHAPGGQVIRVKDLVDLARMGLAPKVVVFGCSQVPRSVTVHVPVMKQNAAGDPVAVDVVLEFLSDAEMSEPGTTNPGVVAVVTGGDIPEPGPITSSVTWRGEADPNELHLVNAKILGDTVAAVAAQLDGRYAAILQDAADVLHGKPLGDGASGHLGR